QEAIARQASFFGVLDQLEFHECLDPHGVNLHLNRAKVKVLWSRREGFNRAIIEAMCAGTPCVMRRGFNYGHQYPFINQQTGCFASETDLPETLVRMCETYQQYSPRTWVLDHMSCHTATEILNDVIRTKAQALGEHWTKDL